MAKPRVHELAKELGTTSKDVLAKLESLGEFVRSASSTVEAPVVRRVKELYASNNADSAGDKPASGSKTGAKKTATKTAATKSSTAKT